MPKKLSKLLQKAIDTLVIQDVYVKSCQAECADHFDPKSTELETLVVQQMHVAQRSELVDIDGDGQLIRIYIRLGARWVNAKENSDPDIKAFVEAYFIAEYKVTTELEQAAIDEFAKKNASYHVWPYWREFLSGQCERLRLPRVVLPTVQFSKQ
ncbi:preprotein translocase subunit SecB [Gammaproteobacteria bacterium AS21]